MFLGKPDSGVWSCEVGKLSGVKIWWNFRAVNLLGATVNNLNFCLVCNTDYRGVFLKVVLNFFQLIYVAPTPGWSSYWEPGVTWPSMTSPDCADAVVVGGEVLTSLPIIWVLKSLGRLSWKEEVVAVPLLLICLLLLRLFLLQSWNGAAGRSKRGEEQWKFLPFEFNCSILLEHNPISDYSEVRPTVINRAYSQKSCSLHQKETVCQCAVPS